MARSRDTSGITGMAKILDDKKRRATFTQEEVESLSKKTGLAFPTACDLAELLDWAADKAPGQLKYQAERVREAIKK